MKLVIFDLDDTLFDTTGQLAGSYEKLDTITPFEHTIPVLNALRAKNIRIVLVTTGDESIQRRKLELLRLAHLFDSVAICADGDSKLDLMRETLFAAKLADSKEAYVVGDRIDREIMYGNRLGCTTVRLLQGKRKDWQPENDEQKPTITLKSIEDFLKLITG